MGEGDGRRSAIGWHRHRARIVVPALGAALALAACGGEEGGSRLLGEPEPTPVQTTEGGTTVTSAPDAGAEGRAVSVRDVSGLEGSAFTAGSVVFVREDRAGAVAAMARAGSAEPGALRHAGFSLDEASLAELEGTATPLNGSGRFPIDVAAGRYLVCLADVFPDHSPGPPYSVVGCDHIDLPGAAVLVVSFAEGGVEAALE